jgi:membrane protein insertase Oxa1/YidC/SpoIIIJ
LGCELLSIQLSKTLGMWTIIQSTDFIQLSKIVGMWTIIQSTDFIHLSKIVR